MWRLRYPVKNGTKSREFRPSKGRRRLLLLEVGSLRRALSSAEARTRRRLWFVLTLSPALSRGSLPFGASLPWFLGSLGLSERLGFYAIFGFGNDLGLSTRLSIMLLW